MKSQKAAWIERLLAKTCRMLTDANCERWAGRAVRERLKSAETGEFLRVPELSQD